MKELVEMVGKKNGYSIIDIDNQIASIDSNIAKLIEAELKKSIEEIIVLAIEYSLSLKKQMKYKGIINFVQDNI